ncbi:MAG: N-acetyltransferase [Saprospiraceae bacterium]|nr:N-acetyltransferase [Saprospiraceae bacterium]
MKIKLRQETPDDYSAVFKLIEAAFKDHPYGDHTEHFLVDRLRQSNAFIPELSIVADLDGEVVGHILLTKVKIKNENSTFAALSLAPVSVKPSYQKQGIGGQLIREAHRVARSLGHQAVILLGHAKYYPKFGYEKTSKYDIHLPFEAAEENCMVIALAENGLDGISGMVEYPKAFFE